ncbi:MAG: sulfatase-like hydrolase/transferase [Candidatus Hydrogenedentes bacterium]|nr:sulfatase-like hydrolase/transferase [Candidatus Hydrogenedentota bacterium]
MKRAKDSLQFRQKPYTGRRRFLKRVAFSAAAALLPATRAAAHSPPMAAKRPNVLFLFSDDQRFDTIRALGNPEILTPNLDQLVQEGTTFTHAHIMGSNLPAVCVPSRAMLMTGRSLFHLQERGNTIPPEHVTLPELLRRDGYTTFATGKWHNDKASFTRSFAQGGKIFFGGMSEHWKVPVFDYDPAGEYARERQYPGEKFSSELFADEATRFLENHAANRPFFLYVAFKAPHDPRTPPKKFADLYVPEKLSVPQNFMPEHPFDNGELRIRDEQLAPWPRTPAIVREHLAAYYGMISHMDSQIGRVLEILRKRGHANNTIVIFASDNGLAVGQHGLLGKQNLYEHSVRVPLIIGGPGIPKGERRSGLCYLTDVFPTVCGLIDAPVPETVEGLSLMPQIEGRKRPHRDSVFGAYRNCQRMARDERWKMILYNVQGHRTTQLFDLAHDPWETFNLAEQPRHAGRVGALTDRLTKWMRTVGDPCDLDKPDWGSWDTGTGASVEPVHSQEAKAISLK